MNVKFSFMILRKILLYLCVLSTIPYFFIQWPESNYKINYNDFIYFGIILVVIWDIVDYFKKRNKKMNQNNTFRASNFDALFN